MIGFDDIEQTLERMLELMQAHGLEEFELERDGVRVRLRKHVAGRDTSLASSPPQESEPAVTELDGSDADHEGAAEPGVFLVKSPIVGTFYRASEPDAEPFVALGSGVRKGQVLCLIEAMKLMNEIDAECDGEITRIFVDNGQPVQYGDTLFAIKTV